MRKLVNVNMYLSRVASTQYCFQLCSSSMTIDMLLLEKNIIVIDVMANFYFFGLKIQEQTPATYDNISFDIHHIYTIMGGITCYYFWVFIVRMVNLFFKSMAQIIYQIIIYFIHWTTISSSLISSKYIYIFTSKYIV